MYTASCHCGNIELKVTKLPESITVCNCSICDRLGARWAYYQPDEVTIKYEKLAPQPYCWGDETIAFQHCPNCGCSTHYSTLEKIDSKRIAINSRMFQAALLKEIPIRNFDGAKAWKYID